MLVRPHRTCRRLCPPLASTRPHSFGLIPGFKRIKERNEKEVERRYGKNEQREDRVNTPPLAGPISTPTPVTTSTSIAPTPVPAPITPENEAEREAEKRRRKTEWKRRQGGETFLDHIIVHIRAGRGGDGCVAFHREKFQPYGPPSGGNGGAGGSVYILPTPHLTTLSSVPPRVRAPSGGAGKGTWQHGRNAPPTIIKVPLGTVVRELPRADPRRVPDEYEAEAAALEGLEDEERREKARDARWVHYPEWGARNAARAAFKEAERQLVREERERRALRRLRAAAPLSLDLSTPDASTRAPDPNAPLGLPRPAALGHLVARGGPPGLGNPHFYSPSLRSPKFATRGAPGEWVSLALELKLLADVGLVGVPNAGKSTLLRALTGGRARTAVAGYAFTTLNPVVAVVRVGEDGAILGGAGEGDGAVYGETRAERAVEQERAASGADAFALTRNAASSSTPSSPDTLEAFRFTVADNPGLLASAASDVGLGHTFLRALERAPALAYVVDLAGDAPWDELRVVRGELEGYERGMSGKARVVVANKADLLGRAGAGEGADAVGEEDEEAVRAARAKLARLEAYVRDEMGVDDGRGGRRALDVVPVSAKYGMNVRRVVQLMRGYVEEARREREAEGTGVSGMGVGAASVSGEAGGVEDGEVYAFAEDEDEPELDEEPPASSPPPPSPQDTTHGEHKHSS
ncbi:hypothetical protein EIP86_009336 [Pleurotus ostreatoroseus]|nr:hypothetical protein EIP86_009336 [Pleurotus ostreatoroseus]